MSYNEILKELKSKLEGSYDKDSAMLRAEGEKFARDGNTEGVKAVGELMFEIMPEEQKAEIERLTHIDGIRLDEYYKKIVTLINENKCVEAKPLAEKLYFKLTEEYAETETAKFVSLRNPFEDYLCHYLFKPEKTLNRAPFDFAEYVCTYAYILIETGSPLDAIPVLKKAEEFNPVDCGPKFELAEVYKLIKNREKMTEITQETMKVASSPAAIARCYANMGYICFEYRELDDAVAFYTASVMFAPNPAIPNELRGIAQLQNKPIEKPSHDQIMTVMKKYGIEFGPSKDVIAVAAKVASNFMIKKDIPNAVMALKLLYNITRDEEVKKLILQYDPKAQLVKADGTPLDEKPNITVTGNANPET